MIGTLASRGEGRDPEGSHYSPLCESPLDLRGSGGATPSALPPARGSGGEAPSASVIARSPRFYRDDAAIPPISNRIAASRLHL